MTQVLSIHQKNPDKRRIKEVIDILDGCGIVLAPTETGYCYLGSASSDSSHEKFLKLRPGHPKNKPFSLLCKDISQVSKIAYLNTKTFRIATRAWPGPYTFVLPCTKNTPKIAAGPKRKTVGIRISSHPIIENIIKEFEHPLLVTSVTDEDELIAQDYFNNGTEQDFWWTNVTDICKQAVHGKIDLAIDCNETVPIHVSTIVDFTQEPPMLLRNGGWDLDFLGIYDVGGVK